MTDLRTGLHHSIVLSVPESHPCYVDHFPERPIIPGALLLQWIAEQLTMNSPAFHVSVIASFRFLVPVVPGDRLEIRFELAPDQHSLRVDCVRNEAGRVVSVAKGKMLLQEIA